MAPGIESYNNNSNTQTLAEKLAEKLQIIAEEVRNRTDPVAAATKQAGEEIEPPISVDPHKTPSAAALLQTEGTDEDLQIILDDGNTDRDVFRRNSAYCSRLIQSKLFANTELKTIY